MRDLFAAATTSLCRIRLWGNIPSLETPRSSSAIKGATRKNSHLRAFTLTDPRRNDIPKNKNKTTHLFLGEGDKQ